MKFNLIKRILLSLGALLIAASASAQLYLLPVKNIDGKRYYYYTVQPKETIFSLAKRFGITQADLIHYNPSVADGLKANQELIFPVGGKYSPVAVVSGKATTDYQVEKGETAYGISRKFGMDINEFYALNPEARDGLRAGQSVKVTASASQSTPAPEPRHTASQPSASGATYIVQHQDTYYSIARNHGLTVAQLQAANPQMKVLREGATIVIPPASYSPSEKAQFTPTASVPSQALAEGSSQVQQSAEQIVETVPASQSRPAAQQADTFVIAVALPFMASDASRGKSAANALDFYKGLLIAVDSIGRNSDHPIKVLTYDTKGTIEGANAILADPKLRSANVIIGPDRADQLSAFADYARRNNIYLLNLFVIKDESFRTNPYVMHANIPHDAMYRKAVGYFLSNFPKSDIVILKRKEGLRDKQEFAEQLMTKARAAGRNVIELEYSGTLSTENLAELPESADMAFIPVSSKTDELSRIISAINNFKKEKAGQTTVSLWGYPEWLVVRNELLDKMHAADTYVFSRFYAVEKDSETDQLDDQFRRWYGSAMSQQVPRQGSYGFDVGVFLIRTMNANGGDFTRNTAPYDGIQNAFNFVGVDGGGLINDELFMLNYTPSKTIFKQGL